MGTGDERRAVAPKVLSSRSTHVDEEMATPVDGPDDMVVVHHLIRRLGRRPSPAEVMAFRQQLSGAPPAPAGLTLPRPRLPGFGHR